PARLAPASNDHRVDRDADAHGRRRPDRDHAHAFARPRAGTDLPVARFRQRPAPHRYRRHDGARAAPSAHARGARPRPRERPGAGRQARAARDRVRRRPGAEPLRPRRAARRVLDDWTMFPLITGPTKDSIMELGLYTFAELQPDPITGSSISPQQRMQNLMEEVELAEQVGLDVFAIGEHHRPDFIVSSP